MAVLAKNEAQPFLEVLCFLCLDDEIVNEACLADIDGDGNECLALYAVNALDVLEIYYLDIVNTCQRFGLEVVLNDLDDFLRVALTIIDGSLAEFETL